MLTNYILAGDAKWCIQAETLWVQGEFIHTYTVKACVEHCQQVNMLHMDYFVSAPDKNQMAQNMKSSIWIFLHLHLEESKFS